MSYLAIDLQCSDCKHEWDDLIERTRLIDLQTCPSCGALAGSRIYRRINAMNVALPDGTKRKGMEELKRAAKLEAEMYQKKPTERAEHKREIDRLRKI